MFDVRWLSGSHCCMGMTFIVGVFVSGASEWNVLIVTVLLTPVMQVVFVRNKKKYEIFQSFSTNYEKYLETQYSSITFPITSFKVLYIL